jgi:hypothetical protein
MTKFQYVKKYRYNSPGQIAMEQAYQLKRIADALEKLVSGRGGI